MSAAAKQDQVLYNFRNPVRMVYANVITPKAFEQQGREKGDPRYDATFLLPPDCTDIIALKDLCIAQLKSVFPGKKLVPRRLTAEEMADGAMEVNVPWSDGTKQADAAKNASAPKDKEFLRGHIAVKASSKFAPQLSGIENGKIVTYTDPNGRANLANVFYRGSWVGPLVAIHTYKSQGVQGESNFKPGGVSLWLNALCFVKHGERIAGAGGVNAAEVFSHYAGSVSNEDPTGGAGDEL